MKASTIPFTRIAHLFAYTMLPRTPTQIISCASPDAADVGRRTGGRIPSFAAAYLGILQKLDYLCCAGPTLYHLTAPLLRLTRCRRRRTRYRSYAPRTFCRGVFISRTADCIKGQAGGRSSDSMAAAHRAGRPPLCGSWWRREASS